MADDVETLGQAVARGWRIKMRCTFGHGAIAKMERCNFSYRLDMRTLLCTRGAGFPLSQLATRLMCPQCGERRVIVSFEMPDEPSSAHVFQHSYKRLR